MNTTATPASTPGGFVAGVRPRKVFIVDDHPIFRRGLVALINAEADLTVCGQASNAPEAIETLRRLPADVAIVDISLPGPNGLELLKHLRAEHPALPVLMVSAHDEQIYALRGLRAGAAGYLMKQEGDVVFVAALRKVLSGSVYVSASVGDQLIYKVARGRQDGSGTPLEVLTDRELEVLHLVGHGRSSRQIAETLHLSVKTVESHRLHVKEKLGLPSAADLVRSAAEWVQQQAG